MLKKAPTKKQAVPTTAIILDKWKPRKDGRYPIKLRITNRRKYRTYACIYDPEEAKVEPLWLPGEVIGMTKDEFSEVFGAKPRDVNKAKRIYINKLEELASEVIRKLGKSFSWEAFERKYFAKPTDEDNLFTGLKVRANELRAEGQISTAMTMECTSRSLKEFSKKQVLPFQDIDTGFLNRYEKWMTNEKKNSLTTVGIYIRNVRAVYNKAARNGTFLPVSYPFGRGRYQIPGGRNIKKALTHKEVGMIANYPAVDGSMEQKARDYWLFSFLCNGINVKDITRLKYSNIDGDKIIFIRSNTARETKSNPRPVVIIITRLIGRIIDRWGVKPAAPDQFIFPILHSDMTPEQEYRAVQQTVHNINKNIRRIAKELNISSNVTSYTARHSFATILMRSGASTEFISESLAHTNVITTQNYLGSFEDDEKRKWAETLANFGEV